MSPTFSNYFAFWTRNHVKIRWINGPTNKLYTEGIKRKTRKLPCNREIQSTKQPMLNIRRNDSRFWFWRFVRCECAKWMRCVCVCVCIFFHYMSCVQRPTTQTKCQTHVMCVRSTDPSTAVCVVPWKCYVNFFFVWILLSHTANDLYRTMYLTNFKWMRFFFQHVHVFRGWLRNIYTDKTIDLLLSSFFLLHRLNQQLRFFSRFVLIHFSNY